MVPGVPRDRSTRFSGDQTWIRIPTHSYLEIYGRKHKGYITFKNNTLNNIYFRFQKENISISTHLKV